MLTAVRSVAKRIFPNSVWNALRLLKDIARSKATGVPRVPLGTDLVGYEKLIRMIRAHDVLRAEGDFVEVGTFLGGGAFKLAKFLEKEAPGRKVHVLDVFDPGPSSSPSFSRRRPRGERSTCSTSSTLPLTGLGTPKAKPWLKSTRHSSTAITGARRNGRSSKKSQETAPTSM